MRTQGNPLNRREKQGQPVVRIALFVFGLLVLLAAILDFSCKGLKIGRVVPDTTNELRCIVLGMGGKRYADVKRLFTIEPPAGWTVQKHPASDPYNVRFFGANGADISITASRVDYNNFHTLLRDIEEIEKKIGVNFHIEPATFLDRPAVKRTSGLHHVRVVSYDFVESNVAHHIQVSIPHANFEQYEPVLMDVIQTYQPTPGKPQAASNSP